MRAIKKNKAEKGLDVLGEVNKVASESIVIDKIVLKGVLSSQKGREQAMQESRGGESRRRSHTCQTLRQEHASQAEEQPGSSVAGLGEGGRGVHESRVTSSVILHGHSKDWALTRDETTAIRGFGTEKRHDLIERTHGLGVR